jgi:hypothetical protein
LSILGFKTDAKVSENDSRRNQKMHFMSTFLARFDCSFKQIEMQKLRDFLELHAFGVCSAIGERFGILEKHEALYPFRKAQSIKVLDHCFS